MDLFLFRDFVHIHDPSAEAVDDVLHQRDIFDFADQLFHAFVFAEKLIDVKFLMWWFGSRFFIIKIFAVRFVFQSRSRNRRWWNRFGSRFRVCLCNNRFRCCLLYTSPSPRDLSTTRMPSSA